MICHPAVEGKHLNNFLGVSRQMAGRAFRYIFFCSASKKGCRFNR